ncbi:hypothetical protein [uncultured Dokdonia sp.]|uniref:hypothetical protein n=1 Tax=uncultured Dokdonia sp. TaxID=575653 RepID=UPI00261BD67E|nr:hypothetical protein [uncultured Dokdonia sp.]
MDKTFYAYKKYIYILCTVVTICCISCKKEVTTTPPKQLDTSLLEEFEVEFLNTTVWLPTSYEKLTYEALFELARVEDDAMINMLLQSSKEYRNKEKKPVFFRDEFMPSNFIAIYPSSYIRLDKKTASYYISDFAVTMKRQDQELGITSEIIEKRIKTFNGHKMVKLKLKQTSDFIENRYFTQYFISSDIRSFMVIHIDVLNRDYELNFKNLSVQSN